MNDYYKYLPEEGRGRFLTQTIRDNEFSVGAEIGTGGGGLAEHLLKNNPDLHLIQVGYYPNLKKKDDSPKARRKQDDALKCRAKWYRVMDIYSDRVTVIEKPSNQAVKEIEDGALDFVFIDANHSYKNVSEDIRIWYPKVREGGMVSGHDFNVSRQRLRGVVRAVREYFKQDFRVGIDCVWYYFKRRS